MAKNLERFALHPAQVGAPWQLPQLRSIQIPGIAHGSKRNPPCGGYPTRKILAKTLDEKKETDQKGGLLLPKKVLEVEVGFDSHMFAVDIDRFNSALTCKNDKASESALDESF